MRLNNSQPEPDKNQENKNSRRLRFGLWPTLIWMALFFLLASWFWRQVSSDPERAMISYSDFREQVRAGNVSEVVVTGEEIQGEFRTAAEFPTDDGGETAEFNTFTTYLPSFGDEGLLALLEEQDVRVETEPVQDLSFLAIALNFLPFLLLIGIGYLFLRRAQGQGQGIFSMGKSRAKLYDQAQERTTFDQVAGLKGAKRELEEIVVYLKEPEKVMRLGGTAPKGVLLVGPPGTGKTLLARAVAGEADVPFFNITGSDFMEMFVGVGASRVRELFKDARRAAPCIIFIDELDSIGRRRGAGLGGGHDEREQTLNQLLSEMDGFEPSENVVVMAATNRPDILDPALLRPGRFDRRITVDLPTLEARKKILEIHARNKPMASDVRLDRLAQGTPGFSGADLENILNESALLASRQSKSEIEWEDIEEARDKVLMGLVREGLALTDEELNLIAYHEGGHAVVAAILPNADPIHKVTIVPRGRAMGVTQQLPEREKYLYPREYLLDRMAVMMGGRAAEDIIFDTHTSGAENDLKQATQLARKMVLDWGMSEKLGHVALGGEREQVFLGEEIAHRRNYSETTAREVDEEIKSILETAYRRASDVLQQYRQELDNVAGALLAKEEIAGEEVMRLIHPEQVAGVGIRT